MSKPNIITSTFIEARISKCVITGCWVWKLAKTLQGYGVVKICNKKYRVHRIVYQLFVGRIPAGFDVLHGCDNPSCCNPAHLFAGTDKDNAADRDRKGRRKAPRGEQHGSAKLTETQARAIRNRTLSISQSAKHFNVSIVTVKRIRNGSSWRHLAVVDME